MCHFFIAVYPRSYPKVCKSFSHCNLPFILWYDFRMSDGTKQPFQSEVAIPKVEGITPEQFGKLGRYLMQGMSESEAALLADIDKLTIIRMRKTSEEYNTFVEKKRLEFKRKHLEVLASKSDPKISQWLLERTDPDFAGKKKADDVPQNAVGAIIRDIQAGNQEGTALSMAYKDKVNDNSNSQRTSRKEATERIKSVLQ